eukprot:2034076-Amphidinium_carterae.1
MKAEMQDGLDKLAEPVALSVSAWHGVELKHGKFRKLHGGHYTNAISSQRWKQLQCSRGFALVYTRTAWERVYFKDDAEPEADFVDALRSAGPPMPQATRIIRNVEDKSQRSVPVALQAFP